MTEVTAFITHPAQTPARPPFTASASTLLFRRRRLIFRVSRRSRVAQSAARPGTRELDAEEEAGAEVRLEIRGQDLGRRGLHVVLDPLELEGAALGVVDGVAGARIEVARLAHRADADDVLPAGAQLE